MFIDAIQKDDKVFAWTREEDGKLYLIEDDLPLYFYEKTKNKTKMKSIFGDNVKKVTFDSLRQYYDYKKKNKTFFESDFSPVYKYLSDNFHQYADKKTPVNVGFFDIESYVDLSLGQGYPTPQNPYGEINGISLFDCKNDKYYILTLDKDNVLNLDLKDEKDGKEIEFLYCVTEKQLLDNFFRLIKHMDVLVTWNGKFYDIPYIMARCQKIYKGIKWKKKMCRDGFQVKIREDDLDRWGNKHTTYKLVGRIHIDLQELYRKFVQKTQPSYSLSYISKSELKEDKVEYEGDLGKLYREDPARFYEYALQDTRLLVRLEDKLKFVDLAISMGRRATIRFDEVIGSIKYIEHSIRNYSHFTRNQPLVLPERDEDAKKLDFDGGFVVPTKPGRYRWSMSIDLASLYPSTIRALNISPERFILQCQDHVNDFIKISTKSDEIIKLMDVKDDFEIELPAIEINQFLKDNNYTITANGSILEDEQGIIPEIIDIWYEERKAMKDKMIELQKQGKKEEAGFYKIRQNLAKASLNSIYGAMSNKSSRFFDMNLAASITLSGQMISKFQIWKADQIIEEII